MQYIDLRVNNPLFSQFTSYLILEDPHPYEIEMEINIKN